MMIVFEGPDGAGKTTLLESLRKRIPYHLVLRTAGPPPTRKDYRLANQMYARLEQASTLPVFGDRMPYFSECVYGPLLRPASYPLNHSPHDLVLPVGVDAVVICLPTLCEQFFKNLGSDENHIPGVESNIVKIWNAYRVMAKTLRANGERVHIYNYLKEGSEGATIDFIRRTLNLS